MVLSPTQKNLTSEMKDSNVSENNVTTKGSLKTFAVIPDLPELEGNITAVVAKVKYTATDSQAYRKSKHPGRYHTSNNIIRVLLGSGSDGNLLFHEKGPPMHFPYLTRQVPLSWYMSNGSFLAKGRS